MAPQSPVMLLPVKLLMEVWNRHQSRWEQIDRGKDYGIGHTSLHPECWNARTVNKQPLSVQP